MAAPSRWDTASEGECADISPRDLAALGEHRALCSVAGGGWIALHCAARGIAVFVSAHRVTTGAMLAAAVGTLLMWR
jgi:hypothetical protein